MADPCIIDTDCIALSGEGTVALPLQADITLDPDADNALLCNPALGLWSDKCEISTDDCNGLINGSDSVPLRETHWTHLLQSRVGGGTVAAGTQFLSTGGANNLVYQSGSLVITNDLCVDAMVFSVIKFGTVEVTSITGGGRVEFGDESRENNGAFTTFGFAVFDNSLEAATAEYAWWPAADAASMGVNTSGGATYEIGFQRTGNLTSPAMTAETCSFSFSPTTIDVFLLAVSGT